MIASLITLLGVAAASGAIVQAAAKDPNWQLVAGLLLAAAAADFTDGKIARFFGEAKGKSLDKWADFYNFGAVGGGVLWLWSLERAAWFGAVTTLAFIFCCGWRLFARRASPMTHFEGMPTTLAILMAGLPLFLWLATDAAALRSPQLCAAFTLMAAAAMVSKWKFRAVGNIGGEPLLLGGGMLAAATWLAVNFWAATAIFVVAIGGHMLYGGRRPAS